MSDTEDFAVSVLLGVGDGNFQAAQTYAATCKVYGTAVGDFNGDGNLDIAVTIAANNGCSS